MNFFIQLVENNAETLSPPRKKKKLPKILDGKIFEIVSIDDEERVEAKCMECLEIRKGNAKSTENFKTHYKKHSSRWPELEMYLKTNTPLLDNSKQSDIREAMPCIPNEEVFSAISIKVLLLMYNKWNFEHCSNRFRRSFSILWLTEICHLM